VTKDSTAIGHYFGHNVRTTARGIGRRFRDRVVVSGKRRGSRTRHTLVAAATRGKSINVWMTHAEIKRLRDALDTIIGDRPIVTPNQLRALGLRIDGK